MPTDTPRMVQDIANDCTASLVEFDPITILTIITTLIGIFKSCMQPPTPAAARAHVVAGYFNGRYNNGTLHVAMHQARRAARKAGTRIDKDEATAIAVATLDRIRLSDDETLQAAMDSLPAVSDDE